MAEMDGSVRVLRLKDGVVIKVTHAAELLRIIGQPKEAV